MLHSRGSRRCTFPRREEIQTRRGTQVRSRPSQLKKKRKTCREELSTFTQQRYKLTIEDVSRKDKIQFTKDILHTTRYRNSHPRKCTRVDNTKLSRNESRRWLFVTMTWDSRRLRIHMMCATITCGETTQLGTTRIDDNMHKKSMQRERSSCTSTFHKTSYYRKQEKTHASMKEHMRCRARQHHKEIHNVEYHHKDSLWHKLFPILRSPIVESAKNPRTSCPFVSDTFLSHSIAASTLIPQDKILIPSLRTFEVQTTSDAVVSDQEVKVYVKEIGRPMWFNVVKGSTSVVFLTEYAERSIEYDLKNWKTTKLKNDHKIIWCTSDSFVLLVSEHTKTSRILRTSSNLVKKSLTERMKRKKWTK